MTNQALHSSQTCFQQSLLYRGHQRNVRPCLAVIQRHRHGLRTVATAANATTGKETSTTTFVTREARRAIFSPAMEYPAPLLAPVVSGELPSWLRGTLVLNGPGNFTGMNHLFDGYACLTRLTFNGDEGALASQRFLGTDAYGSFRRTGRMKYREFNTPLPAEGPIGRALVVMENFKALVSKGRAFTDNASVSVTPLPNGKLLALSETRSAAYLLHPTSLLTGPQVEYPDRLPGDLTTAHPKVAPDGSLINFTRSLPFGGYHVFRQDPATLERRQIAFIPDRDPFAPGWIHDMAISERHLVIVEPPVFINLESLVIGTPREFAFMDWKPELGTKVHVVALDGSGVVTHTAPPLFTFHFANAFERPSGSGSGSEVCVDFNVYADPRIVNDLNLAPMQAYPGTDVSPSGLRRLTIPLRDAAGRPVGPSNVAAPAPLLKDESAYGNFFEFPVVSPRVRCKAHRYVYGMAAVRPTNMGNALARHDVQEGTSKLWFEPGGMPGEPTFVPRPDGTAEDDGVVLAAVAQPDGTSALVVLDGSDMREVARLELPFVVPYRFHGTFITGTESAY